MPSVTMPAPSMERTTTCSLCQAPARHGQPRADAWPPNIFWDNRAIQGRLAQRDAPLPDAAQQPSAPLVNCLPFLGQEKREASGLGQYNGHGESSVSIGKVFKLCQENATADNSSSSSCIAIPGGRIRPSATYRPWNMSGSALFGSIPDVHKTVPVHRYHPLQ